MNFPNKLTTGLILFLSLVAGALAQRNYPPNLPEAEAKTYKTIGDVKLDLYVYKPEGWKADDKRPAVVFFFGGGWKAGSPAQFKEQCKYLAKRGMVAITADYRVLSRHKTPAKDCVVDARDAMRWVRSHADQLGIDPNRLASGGGSAGGHIAACLGTLDPGEEDVSSVPDAMILFNPACVLAPLDGATPWPEDRSKELAERMGTDPKNLSPAHHVKAGAAPCAVFHGTDDPTVPFSTAEAFTKKMTEAGNRCELFAYAGEGHGFFNYGKKENKLFNQTMADLDKFLVSLGWLE